MNSQTGKEMLVNLVEYHVYQQLKADELKASLIMTMQQFDDRWNIVVLVCLFAVILHYKIILIRYRTKCNIRNKI